jgi:hypothetical protein
LEDRAVINKTKNKRKVRAEAREKLLNMVRARGKSLLIGKDVPADDPMGVSRATLRALAKGRLIAQTRSRRYVETPAGFVVLVAAIEQFSGRRRFFWAVERVIAA